MITASTSLFVLALLALLSAGLALLTCYRLARDMDSLKSSSDIASRNSTATIERLKQTIAGRLAELDRRSPQTLAAEVAALGEAVARLRLTHQKFAGRFDQYVTNNEPQSTLPNINGILDPELAAELALQAAPPARPGG